MPDLLENPNAVEEDGSPMITEKDIEHTRKAVAELHLIASTAPVGDRIGMTAAITQNAIEMFLQVVTQIMNGRLPTNPSGTPLIQPMKTDPEGKK